MQKLYVPTAMGLALAKAATKVDHSRANNTNWVSRRVVLNLDRPGLGVKPVVTGNAHLKLKTYKRLKAAGVME